jgi:hypothetical protein
MSAAKPFVVSDDDDELVGGSDSELELVDYGKSASSGARRTELTLVQTRSLRSSELLRKKLLHHSQTRAPSARS